MTEPRIVTPQEASECQEGKWDTEWGAKDILHTVATEPDRTRAAVVKALRRHGDSLGGLGDTAPLPRDAYAAAQAWKRAAAIENGADL